MEKKLLEEINNVRNIMGLPTLTEKYSRAVDPGPNVDFKDFVIGGSQPSKDSINPLILRDIQVAAKNAGVKVYITTAVSGHSEKTKKGTLSRHSSGDAVDIAMVNNDKGTPVGWSSKSAAKNKGIDDNLESFVKELVKLGYRRDTAEKNSKKVVLTYNYDYDHRHHIHISNSSKSSDKEIDTDDGEFNISAEKAKSKELNIGAKDDIASTIEKKSNSLDPRDELKNTIKQEIDKMKKMTNPTDDIKTAIKDLIKSLET